MFVLVSGFFFVWFVLVLLFSLGIFFVFFICLFVVLFLSLIQNSIFFSPQGTPHSTLTGDAVSV